MSEMSEENQSRLRRAWVETDLAALERNLGKIKAALPPRVRYISVVKADAYGHGVGPTVSRLLQCGADCFCVANTREGAEVRELGPGAGILVLGAVLPEERPLLFEYGLTAALSTEAETLALAKLAERRNQRLPVHIKIDTGMGRMGVWHENAADFIRYTLGCRSLELRGVFTHFSSADSAKPDDAAFTHTQRARFVRAIETIPHDLREAPDFLIHADNSAGLETFAADGPFNAVRVGLLQYGLPPRPDSLLARLQTEPVLSFHSRVGLVKTLPVGTRAGRVCRRR
jgi:alanine racemase